MAKPRNRQDNNRAEAEDITRVDSFRTEEDTGGAAAPPLRPRDETRQDRRDEPAKPAKR